MSIESLLERIAFSLENIANNTCKDVQTSIPNIEEITKLIEKDDPVEKVIRSKPVKKQPPVIELSITELNELLIPEFERLGNDKEIIMKVIQDHGAPSLNSLDPSKYAEVLEAVRKVTK